MENPCGDWADIQDSGTFAMNLRCNIVMDDGSVIYFEYRGKFRFDQFGADYAEKGKLITPFKGTKYWMALLLMKKLLGLIIHGLMRQYLSPEE